jgi:hypothetical protein
MSLDTETIKVQLQNLEVQKNNAQAIFNQCVGAISVLNEQLVLIEQKAKELVDAKDLAIEGEDNGAEVDTKSNEQEQG